MVETIEKALESADAGPASRLPNNRRHISIGEKYASSHLVSPKPPFFGAAAWFSSFMNSLYGDVLLYTAMLHIVRIPGGVKYALVRYPNEPGIYGTGVLPVREEDDEAFGYFSRHGLVYDVRTADKGREDGLVVVPVPSSNSGSGMGQCVLTYMASDIGPLDEFVRRLEEEHVSVRYQVCALTGPAQAAPPPAQAQMASGRHSLALFQERLWAFL